MITCTKKNNAMSKSSLRKKFDKLSFADIYALLQHLKSSRKFYKKRIKAIANSTKKSKKNQNDLFQLEAYLDETKINIDTVRYILLDRENMIFEAKK
jgi:hypothetical protein